MLSYRDYTAAIEFDADDLVFVGRVVGIRDGITFEGETVAELSADFHAAVDQYLEACERLGKEPNRPYSGKLLLRLGSDLHRRLDLAAQAKGTTLTDLAREAVRERLDREGIPA